MSTIRQIAVIAMTLFGCPILVAAQEPEFLESLLADVVRMEAKPNNERGEVLQSVLTEYGIPFELETFEIRSRPDYPRTTGTNIVVTIGNGDRDIVIGGHYDAAPLGNGEFSPGATDNAASAVILTRLAVALVESDRDARIRIVMYDMEEIGLLGSANFIRQSRRRISAAINLDINGYGDTLFYFLPEGPAGTGALFDAMTAICSGTEFRCKGTPAYPASDHLTFANARIPSTSLAILPAADVDALIAMADPARQARPRGAPPSILRVIHTANDTSRLVDPEAMWQTYRAVLALVEELSPAR